jgi:hypothetical protein
MRKLYLLMVGLVVAGVGMVVSAEQGDSYEVLEAAIQKLQPATDDERAARLAGAFAEAGKQHDFDPKLLIAISFRESSLHPEMEELRRFGKSRGEIGLMQCHGVALRFRPEECQSNLKGAWCQIQTGTRFLAHIRDNACPGSTWRVLAAYGHGVCMSEREATHDRGVKNVIRYYRVIGGRED